MATIMAGRSKKDCSAGIRRKETGPLEKFPSGPLIDRFAEQFTPDMSIAVRDPASWD